MRVLGHRGCVHPGPENTVAAVRVALDAGADGVEVDVRRSADGVLMCSHDPVAQGLTVFATAAADLARLAVPTVAQVLAAAGGQATVVLEVKNIPGDPDFDAPAEATAHALVDELAALPPDERSGIVVSSFDWFALDVVRDSELDVPVAFLTLPLVAARRGCPTPATTDTPSCTRPYRPFSTIRTALGGLMTRVFGSWPGPCPTTRSHCGCAIRAWTPSSATTPPRFSPRWPDQAGLIGLV